MMVQATGSIAGHWDIAVLTYYIFGELHYFFHNALLKITLNNFAKIFKFRETIVFLGISLYYYEWNNLIKLRFQDPTHDKRMLNQLNHISQGFWVSF